MRRKIKLLGGLNFLIMEEYIGLEPLAKKIVEYSVFDRVEKLERELEKMKHHLQTFAFRSNMHFCITCNEFTDQRERDWHERTCCFCTTKFCSTNDPHILCCCEGRYIRKMCAECVNTKLKICQGCNLPKVCTRDACYLVQPKEDDENTLFCLGCLQKQMEQEWKKRKVE